ncbi:MAG: HTH domain-containing protein [Acinetobacter sp.]
MTAQILAERLQISQRSVYRDIESLRSQGVHIDAAAGLGFQLKKDFNLRSNRHSNLFYQCLIDRQPYIKCSECRLLQ